MTRQVFAILILSIFCILLFVMLVTIRSDAEREIQKLKRAAIINECAGYDIKTGKFTWKDEFSVTKDILNNLIKK